jgi:hypothetical protein
MKKIILCVAITMLVLACLWRLAHKNSASDSTLPANASSTNQPVKAVKAIATNLVIKPKSLTRPSGIDDIGWARLLDLRNVLLRENQPIEFYARVIDQNGEPVVGARMELHFVGVNEDRVASPAILHMKMGDEQEFLTNSIYSDANGLLKFDGIRSKDLTVWLLSKEGYVSPYEIGGNHILVRYGLRERQDLDRNITDPAKGMMFQLWKKGETEKLIQWSKGYRVTRTSHDQTISLLSTQGGQTDYVDFTLKTSAAHPEITEGDRAYDRWIIIEGIADTGLQETLAQYPYFAPQDGYVHDFKFLYQNDSRNGEDWTRNFYVKARNGKLFASMIIKFSSQSGLTLDVKATVNPTGSRNLEPDSTKLITDPAEIRHIDESTRAK